MDIVCLSVPWSQLTIRAYNHYNYYNHYSDYSEYNDYRDSNIDLNLDGERFSELVTY